MDNPNESILLTEQGTPIGEVVVADNSSLPAVPPEGSLIESREAALRTTAAEITGDPDAAAAVAELYPGYGDAEKRRAAMLAFVTDSVSMRSIADKVGVPERTVSMWAYNFGWDRLVRQEIAAQQARSITELAKVRATRRTRIVEEQLEQAKQLRDIAMKKLHTGEASAKPAAEAWAAAAKVEHTLTGLSEAGTVAGIDPEDDERRKKDGGKQPLVMVFQGGLPPVRRHQP